MNMNTRSRSTRPGRVALALAPLAPLLVVGFASPAVGDTIAFTSFEEPGAFGGTNSEVVQVTNGSLLPNQAGKQNRQYDATLPPMQELAFSSRWFNTGPGGANAENSNTGPSSSATDGDEVGVETGNASGITASDGAAFYGFDDTDGAVEVTFEPVSLAGFSNIQVSLDAAFSSTDWEVIDGSGNTLDGFSVIANGTTIYSTFGLDFDSAADRAALGLNNEGQYTTLTFDSSDLGTPATLTLAFRASTSSGSEDILLDNLRITGDPTTIPEPASASLLLLAAGTLTLRRRR